MYFITYVSDVEHIIVLGILALLFISGVRKREYSCTNRLALDLSVTTALKGVACIFILMGHYETIMHSRGYSNVRSIGWLIWLTSANIALFWFMFISGYGLTKSNKKVCINNVCSRLAKVYLPLLYIGTVSILFYVVLPAPYSHDDLNRYMIPIQIQQLDTFDISCLYSIVYKALGLGDWYVMCIIVFYMLFYISDFISGKTKLSITLVLGTTLLLYFIFAYIFIDAQHAHYFRYPWVFFAGHVLARWESLSKNRMLRYMLALLPFISIMITDGKYMWLSFFIAYSTLVCIMKLNTKYTYSGRSLAFLGIVSYFFYLVHQRISWVALYYGHIFDLSVWIISTIIISYSLMYIYKRIFE